MTHYDSFDSPLGGITVATEGPHITRLHINGDRYFTSVPADWSQNADHPLLRQAKIELAQYFAGQRHSFDLPLAPAGTRFQQQVWNALRAIPLGSTTTYTAIAELIGRPTAARAVGTAIGRNPICLFIPCHRVLASGGGFGGYVAGIACKRQLLSLEGALS